MTGGDTGFPAQLTWLFTQHLLTPPRTCWMAGASLEPPRTPPRPTNSRRRRKKKNRCSLRSQSNCVLLRARFSIGPHKPQEGPCCPPLALCRQVVLLDHCCSLRSKSKLRFSWAIARYRWTIAHPLLAIAGPLLATRWPHARHCLPSVMGGKAGFKGAGPTVKSQTQPNSAFPRPLSAFLRPLLTLFQSLFGRARRGHDASEPCR